MDGMAARQILVDVVRWKERTRENARRSDAEERQHGAARGCGTVAQWVLWGRIMKTFSWLLAFVLIRVCLGAEQKPAPTPQAKEAEFVKTFDEWLSQTKDKNSAHRAVAAEFLGTFNSEAKAAIPALTKLLVDEDRDVREHAAIALDKLDPDARATIPALMHFLKDADSRVRSQAAWTLGEFGPTAKPAIPTLVESLKDKVADVLELRCSPRETSVPMRGPPSLRSWT